MSYSMQGKIKLIGDLQTFSSGFTKREVVITTEDKYPQDIKMDALKDKTSMLDEFKPGDVVKVSFDIRGREYNERHYVDLALWKIEKQSGEASGSSDEHIPEDTTDYGQEEPPF